jgi:hypothetical protein
MLAPDRVAVARRMGLQVQLRNWVRAGTNDSLAVFSCRCGRNSAIVALTGRHLGMNIDNVLGCPCLPSLGEVFSRQEFSAFLLSLPTADLEELRQYLPPESKSPRRGEKELDEGPTDARERDEQQKDSAADSGQQSRIMPEGNDLLCALHGDACLGHEPPEGAA